MPINYKADNAVGEGSQLTSNHRVESPFYANVLGVRDEKGEHIHSSDADNLLTESRNGWNSRFLFAIIVAADDSMNRGEGERNSHNFD